jgi:tRNA uridine 5-carboxymethylaminomethyl modification enzyme
MYGDKTWVRELLEAQEGLHIKQGMVEGFLVEKSAGVSRIGGVYTQAGEEFISQSVVVASGTFLNGLIHVGMTNYPAGRAGEFPSVGLSGALEALDLKMGRLKTGTTPRLDAKTIDFDSCQVQHGDEVPSPFSFRTREIDRPQVPCWITRTNQATHDAIRGGLDRSPLYGGVIKGVGPRYCPSIEDKIVRFPDKTGHHVFLEPEGLHTREYYPNGVSTSLPIDVQIKMLRTIPGLEEVQIMRPGYAIEYDFVHPTQLGQDLMVRTIEGLYLAGQINGTSGYEEAAAQGLIAGMNAALRVKGEPPLTLGRDEAYIGVLVDDLVTKGVTEPYRLFTSRAEYRLMLREDNADLRLMEKGYRAGLITDEEVLQLREKARVIENGLNELRQRKVTIALSNGPPRGTSLAQVLKKPEVSYGDLVNFDQGFVPMREEEAARQVEIQVKYEGYIARQMAMVARMARLESMPIPEDLEYSTLQSLSREVRDRLEDVRPANLGQASRIPGITPAAVSALMVYLRARGKEKVERGCRAKPSSP